MPVWVVRNEVKLQMQIASCRWDSYAQDHSLGCGGRKEVGRQGLEADLAENNNTKLSKEEMMIVQMREMESGF